MKQIFTKLTAIAFMTLLSGHVMATDYYISETGNDANDGKSKDKAVATFNAALIQKLGTGDVLHVSGTIKMTAQCSAAHKNNIIIQGEDPTKDGFDGQDQCGILSLNNSYYKLENLFFKRGKVSMGGAAVMGNPVSLTIENCIFEDNVNEATNANQAGGALYFSGGATATVQNQPCGVTIRNSKFINNKNTTINGGAVRATTLPVIIEQCYFDGNQAAQGGAIALATPYTYTIKQCLFTNNSATYEGGAINVYLKQNTTETFKGPYDIVSSTFYKNSSVRNGICQFNVSGNATTDDLSDRIINIVNCTMADNQAAAVVTYGANAHINIINSILEDNNPSGGTNYTDVNFSGADFTKQKMTLISSIIGSISGYNASNYTVTNCCLNKTANASAAKYAGLASFQDNCLPLLQASLSTKIGAATENRPDNDQLGNAWTENYIGAVQKVVEPEDGAMYVASLNDDGTTNEVTICRKLVGNEWNTICLPFNLNNKADDPNQEEYDKYFGENAKVACIYNQTVKDGVIVFTDRSNKVKGDLVAGRPNLVMPTEDKTVIITKPWYKVNSNYVGASYSTVKDAAGNEYKFIGVFNSTNLQTTDVCLGRGGYFFHPSEGKTKMPGLRGYFQFPENANVGNAKVFISGVSDTTDIIDLKANGTAKNAKIYTLGGQYMGTDAQSLPKGIYVIGNKKVVIK